MLSGCSQNFHSLLREVFSLFALSPKRPIFCRRAKSLLTSRPCCAIDGRRVFNTLSIFFERLLNRALCQGQSNSYMNSAGSARGPNFLLDKERGERAFILPSLIYARSGAKTLHAHA